MPAAFACDMDSKCSPMIAKLKKMYHLLSSVANAAGGYRIVANIRPCQGRATGSIPVTRSKIQKRPPYGLFLFYLKQNQSVLTLGFEPLWFLCLFQ